jgi:hypothetical protein
LVCLAQHMHPRCMIAGMLLRSHWVMPTRTFARRRCISLWGWLIETTSWTLLVC